MLEAVDRSGAIGWTNEANNLASTFSGGLVNYQNLLGQDKQLTRFQARGATSQFIGASGDFFDGMATVGRATATNDWSQGDINAARRLVPMQNLVYWNWLLNRIFKD